uniref:Sodium/calcium exchanger membrane region domain-containing protein n=1 Tax=Corethron hystrix TaxID=216773 RepID=A0A7S1C2L9_9STRA|mmetsp:Transcript_9709/g.21611  ORF Transcript_9709/g.21611 Transcript_9709/m.21611 type:complete len:290 (+) Transcript_9709:884-1753(+)
MLACPFISSSYLFPCQALLANEIRVVQASLMGSIFSNLLLVQGCSFFFGGLKFKEQRFNSIAATANSSLLMLSSLGLILPTPYASYNDISNEEVLVVSRITAIFMLMMYLQLLLFQLVTHKDIFDDDSDDKPTLSFRCSMVCISLLTLLVAVFSEYLVDSIAGFADGCNLSRTFVGIIILPIIGNCVEHISAVSMAMRNKIDLAMGIAIGSCTQIGLFVVPMTVLIGWACGKDMTLNYPHYEIGVYFLAILISIASTGSGTTNWLAGSLLVTTYLMLAVGFFYEKVEDF